jgi:hypothetical protein
MDTKAISDHLASLDKAGQQGSDQRARNCATMCYMDAHHE